MDRPEKQRRTAAAALIEQTFVQLLLEEERSSISVAWLCKRAGLNRSTFYANFSDLDAVANALCASLEARFRELDLGRNEDGFVRLFEHIRDHQPLYRAYFKLGRNLRYESVHGAALIDRAYPDASERAYHSEFFRAGITGVIRKWLLEGCAASPGEMARIIRSELPRPLTQAGNRAADQQKRHDGVCELAEKGV